MNRHSGFTLVELMITLALVAILATVGVPSFIDFIANNRVIVQTNELVGALNLARSEAVKRGARVTVCRRATDTSCGDTWNNGWLVFVDAGAAGSVDTGDEVLRVWGATNSAVSLVSTQNAVQFQNLGLTTNTTFTLTPTPCHGPRVRSVDVSVSGRISTVKANCP
jgi:type IV fimbrial biogenesis protein FimT